MAIVKVIEVLAEGNTLEEAVSAAVEEAGKTIDDIRNVWVNDFQAIVEDNQVARYRVNAKVSFLLHDEQRRKS